VVVFVEPDVVEPDVVEPEVVEPEVDDPQPGVMLVVPVDPVVPVLVVLPVVVLPVVVLLPGVVVVVPVAVPVLVPPAPGVSGLVLSDAVCTVPFASLVVALADVRLPLASRVYCAVPEPAPQAVSITETPVKAVSESARMAVTSNDTFNIKYFSHVNFVISDKRSHANACVRALLYEKSSGEK
jgi:hypothetical protein